MMRPGPLLMTRSPKIAWGNGGLVRGELSTARRCGRGENVRGTFRGTFGALRGTLTPFRSLPRPSGFWGERLERQRFQWLEWRARTGSNRQPSVSKTDTLSS
jgi:hypothetical protein